MSLSKIVAYVTGAGQGLGKATALRLASLGARVMVVDVSEERAKEVATEIGPSRAIYSVVDVTDEDKVKASVQELCKKWGHVNCAVNCAGGQILFLDLKCECTINSIITSNLGIAPPMRTLSKKGQPHDLNQFA